MTISQIARDAVENGAVLIRFREKREGQLEYDVKVPFTGQNRGWTLFDIQTANAMSVVYDALSPENQAKFDSIPLRRLVDFVWRHVRVVAPGQLA